MLHYPDGSIANYGLADTSDPYYGVFYMTTMADPDGIATTFRYDSNFYLTNAAAADGTSFTFHFGNVSLPDAVTSVSTSYGVSASFGYLAGSTAILTSITDAAGMTSDFGYYTPSQGDSVTGLTTPYGTTEFDLFGANDPGCIFQRTMQITNADGTQELYAQLDPYTGSSWPDYATSQIPTNTPVGTLDKDAASRQGRNTFYWNPQQFAPLIGLSFASFDWPQFKRSHIRHWLANTDPSYTHWDTLSLEQDPSPDGGTTEGQLTWYDYVGKPANTDYEIGTQVLPSVIARVMPDGSTWYKYYERLTNGAPTKEVEAWMDSGSVHTRTNTYLYAANNVDLVAVTNALGVRVVSNAYNAFHQVVTNYDALGQVTTNGYDSTTHLITARKNPAGLVTTFSYNGSGRLSQITDQPVNRTQSFTWNADGTLATYTDARGMVETFFWDDLRRLTGTSDARGSTTNLYYILSGTPFPNSSGGTAILDRTATRDRLGNWTSFVYDSLRRKIAETNANGVVTAYGYCSCGAVNSVTNALNTAIQQVTALNFDTQGRLTNTLYADNYSTTNWFDSLGRITLTGDGAANHWFAYNNLGLLTIKSNAYGAELTETYDLLDRPQYVTDANGVMVTNTYDSLNRLLTRGFPDGGVERFGYSPKGLAAYTNQLTLASYFGYDELGRKTYETNANGEIFKFTNNAAGDLLSLTDGKNQTTRWRYDQYGRVTNKLDQAGFVILKYFYDAQNRLTNRWSAAKGFTYYTNDAVGNLTYIKYPTSSSVGLKYDPLNRLTNMVDGVGTTVYSYTAGNQVWTEVEPYASSTITNTYANRLRISMALQQPTGLWTNRFIYDAAGRLTNVTSAAGAFSYAPWAASAGGRLIKKLLLPNTSYITNTFDSVARLTGTFLKNSGGSILDSAVYGYNQANQRTAFTNATGIYNLYGYDNIGQLIVANSSVSGENHGYSYDPAWNLSYLTNGEVVPHFTVDVDNQLTSDPNSYDSYDSNGNLSTRTNLSLTYTYDDENRLVAVTNGTAWSAAFAYDGLGRLRKQSQSQFANFVWGSTNLIEYIYDGTRVIQERDNNNNPTVSYTRGTDLSGSLERAGGIGGLLARSSGYSGGNWTTHYFYHADGNGNITFLVDASQALAASYRYDPFGNTLASSGSLAGANVYRFSSKEIQVNTGMYIYLYRFYDPSLQRWLNRDPILEYGGINLYAFSLNGPVIFIDGFGNSPEDCSTYWQIFKNLWNEKGSIDVTLSGGDILGGELRLTVYPNGKVDIGWGVGFGVGQELTITGNLNSGEEQGFNVQAEVAGGSELIGASILAEISQGGINLSAGGGLGVGTGGTLTGGMTFTVYDPNAPPTFTDSTLAQYSGGYVNLTQTASQPR